MKKLMLAVMSLLMIVGCSSENKIKLDNYEYNTKGIEFKADTEQLRNYFENAISNIQYVNVALGIYENGDFISYRSSDESDIALDLNVLYDYYVSNDYNLDGIKLIFAYAVYNEHRIDKDDRMYEKVYDFIDFMELHEYEYNSKNINKWKYSVYQTLVDDKDKEDNKNFYYDYVVNVLKTMNK